MVVKQVTSVFKMKTKEDNSFFKRVYEVASLIPYGRVTNYGAIANYLGSGGSGAHGGMGYECFT